MLDERLQQGEVAEQARRMSQVPCQVAKPAKREISYHILPVFPEDMLGIVLGAKKIKGLGFILTPCHYLAGDGRLERPAFGSGDQRSIHLS